MDYAKQRQSFLELSSKGHSSDLYYWLHTISAFTRRPMLIGLMIQSYWKFLCFTCSWVLSLYSLWSIKDKPRGTVWLKLFIFAILWQNSSYNQEKNSFLLILPFSQYSLRNFSFTFKLCIVIYLFCTSRTKRRSLFLSYTTLHLGIAH